MAVLGLSREKESIGYIFIREIYFGQLASGIGKFKNLQGGPAGWRPREELQFESKRQSAGRIPSCIRRSSSVLKPFNLLDEVPPHYGEKSALLNVY